MKRKPIKQTVGYKRWISGVRDGETWELAILSISGDYDHTPRSVTRADFAKREREAVKADPALAPYFAFLRERCRSWLMQPDTAQQAETRRWLAKIS